MTWNNQRQVNPNQTSILMLTALADSASLNNSQKGHHIPEIPTDQADPVNDWEDP